MKKLFMQLIAEFKRLGANIVFANFTKVILCTKKHKMLDALAYTEYIVNNIRSKEIFQNLDIVYKQGWEYLLWLGPVSNTYYIDSLKKNYPKYI